MHLLRALLEAMLSTKIGRQSSRTGWRPDSRPDPVVAVQDLSMGDEPPPVDVGAACGFDLPAGKACWFGKLVKETRGKREIG